ncbi:hypothetical protein ACHAPD_006556 [Fusarium lateritium]
MAVAEGIDRGSAVEAMIDESVAVVLEIVVDAAVAEDAAPVLGVAAAHIAGVVDVVPGLVVAVLETVVEVVPVEATVDEAVDAVSIGGEVAESVGLGVAVAGWTVRLEQLVEHCGFDVDFAEDIQDELVVQDDKIEDVAAGHSAAESVAADCEDSHPLDTVAVAAAGEQVYAQVKRSAVKAMILQIVFQLAF